MADISLDDSELRKLAADLENADKRVGAKVSKVIRQSTGRVQRAAVSRAPKDTGVLRENIRTMIVGTGNKGRMSGIVISDSRQGFFQERGTSRMAAQPYMQPALDAEAPKFTEALEQALSEALDD